MHVAHALHCLVNVAFIVQQLCYLLIRLIEHGIDSLILQRVGLVVNERFDVGAHVPVIAIDDGFWFAVVGMDGDGLVLIGESVKTQPQLR